MRSYSIAIAKNMRAESLYYRWRPEYAGLVTAVRLTYMPQISEWRPFEGEG
jgi:hypothetical protein